MNEIKPQSQPVEVYDDAKTRRKQWLRKQFALSNLKMTWRPGDKELVEGFVVSQIGVLPVVGVAVAVRLISKFVKREIRFHCPACTQHLTVESRGAGVMIECPTCKEVIQIPS